LDFLCKQGNLTTAYLFADYIRSPNNKCPNSLITSAHGANQCNDNLKKSELRGIISVCSHELLLSFPPRSIHHSAY